MPRFERFQRAEAPEVMPLGDPGATSRALAQALGQVGRMTTQVTLQRRAAEGERAGQLVGVDAPEARSEFTAYGRAFNAAAQRAHAAAVDSDIRLTLARISEEEATDTAAFDARVGGYREGLLERIDPQLLPAVQQELDLQTQRYRSKVHAAEQRLLLAENMGTLVDAAEGIQNDTLAAARDGDIDIVEHQRAKYIEMIEGAAQTTENPDGLLAPARVREMVAAFERSIDIELVVGDFERILREDGAAAGQEAFDEFERTGIRELGALTTEDRDRLTNRMQTLLNRQMTRENRDAQVADAAERARLQELKRRTDEAVRVLAAGFEPEGIEELFIDAQGTEQESRVALAIAQAGQAQRFALADPRTQEVILNQLEADMRGRPIDPVEMDRLQRFQRIHANMQREIDQDALSFGQRQGIIEPVEPLDFTDPDALAEGLAARREAAATLEGQYRRPVSTLTAQEAAELGEMLGSGTAGEQLQILTGIVAGLGPAAASTIETLHKQGYEVLAFAGGMMTEGNPAARDVLLGRQLLASDPKLAPPDIDARPELELLRQAYPPGASAAAVQAVTAHYARLSAIEGDHTAVFDRRRFRRSVEAVTGGIIEHRAGRTRSYFPAPERGMRDRDFRDWIRGLEDADIEAMGGVAGMSPSFVREQLQERARLVPIGRGRWLVSLTSASDGGERFLHAENPADPAAPEFVLEWGR